MDFNITIISAISLLSLFCTWISGLFDSNFQKKIKSKFRRSSKTNQNDTSHVQSSKYDGFSDSETRTYAKGLGAQNIKDFALIQKYHAPNYPIVKKIISGNFKTYEQLMEAESLGASNSAEVFFVKKYKAPDLRSALQVEKGNFHTYEQYQDAKSK